MTDIRDQAAKATTWAEEKMRDPEFRKIAEEEFGKMDVAEKALAEAYLTGHAAGVEEGARAFAGWLKRQAEYQCVWIADDNGMSHTTQSVDYAIARFLAERAESKGE
jgi:hypothetical protein